jgi:AcrR family transcriptional regulator
MKAQEKQQEPSHELAWMRTPRQARSQATLTRLLDALEDLLESCAFDALTVASICRAARSSVGAFYTRFPDKQSLLHLLHARMCDEASATARAALAVERWEGVSLPDAVATMTRFIVDEHRTRRGVRRELVRQCALDPTFARRAAETAAVTTRAIALLLDARRDEWRGGCALMHAEMVHRVLFAVLDQEVMFGGEQPVAPIAPLPVPEPPAGVARLPHASSAAHRGEDLLARELALVVGRYLGLRVLDDEPAERS